MTSDLSLKEADPDTGWRYLSGAMTTCPTCHGDGWSSSMELVGVPGADPMYGGCPDCQAGEVVMFPKLWAECPCTLVFAEEWLDGQHGEACDSCVLGLEHAISCFSCSTRRGWTPAPYSLELLLEAAEAAGFRMERSYYLPSGVGEHGLCLAPATGEPIWRAWNTEIDFVYDPEPWRALALAIEEVNER
jgi:hypothetical protein